MRPNESRADLRVGGLAFPLRFQRGALADYTGTVRRASRTRCWRRIPKPAGAACSTTATCGSRRTRARSSRERKNARAAFGGRRNIWWDDLDLLYFAGYALWGYVVRAVHLHAPGLRGRGDRAVARGRRGAGRGCGSRFPDDVPAHSREQSYYFGPDGLIRRNDYTAEVFGGWAKATHYCWDYREFGGFMVPTRRRGDAARARGQAGARRSRSCRSRSTTCARSDLLSGRCRSCRPG